MTTLPTCSEGRDSPSTDTGSRTDGHEVQRCQLRGDLTECAWGTAGLGVQRAGDSGAAPPCVALGQHCGGTARDSGAAPRVWLLVSVWGTAPRPQHSPPPPSCAPAPSASCPRPRACGGSAGANAKPGSARCRTSPGWPACRRAPVGKRVEVRPGARQSSAGVTGSSPGAGCQAPQRLRAEPSPAEDRGRAGPWPL